MAGFTVYFANLVATEGRPSLYFLTFFLGFLLDQAKSVGFLYAIYFVVVRRFMHLPINEHEFLKPEILALPKQENLLPRS